LRFTSTRCNGPEGSFQQLVEREDHVVTSVSIGSQKRESIVAGFLPPSE
jgi:hypothetical protein